MGLLVINQRKGCQAMHLHLRPHPIPLCPNTTPLHRVWMSKISLLLFPQKPSPAGRPRTSYRRMTMSNTLIPRPSRNRNLANQTMSPRVARAQSILRTRKAGRRQDAFKSGAIHLLSSSSTFEVGVDLGDLDSVFLRNVPPESFNYAQRAGRAGRRDTPGLVLTYCRRNPHDLYHYEDPVGRVIAGAIHPPRLHMANEKIVMRHMVAVALTKFFKKDPVRFGNVETFVAGWHAPRATSNLCFCEANGELKETMRRIVPQNMHGRVGLDDDAWVVHIAGEDSRLALAEADASADFTEMEALRRKCFEQGKDSWVGRVGRRMKTIADEGSLSFLSRKAVTSRYGFPVDVVEFDVRSTDDQASGVALQRDLSQAIAEYAPGGKVVANKLEWESCGVKKITGKDWPVRHYRYDDARNFRQWNEGGPDAPSDGRKYLIPEFGFVTPLFKKPSEPQGRAQRLYTTRPFFRGFDMQPEDTNLSGVQVTRAVPGVLVVLCEGRHGEGFYICRSCGTHMAEPKAIHKSPSDSDCPGTLERFSLGRELATDVVRLQFAMVRGEWDTYSVAYAALLGAAGNRADLRRGTWRRHGTRAGQLRLRLELLRLPPQLPQSIRTCPTRPDPGTGYSHARKGKRPVLRRCRSGVVGPFRAVGIEGEDGAAHLAEGKETVVAARHADTVAGNFGGGDVAEARPEVNA